jgi:plastocyanin
VEAGDTVRWVNEDIVPHSATDNTRACDSGEIGANQSWVVVPDSTASYFCVLHPTMRGVVAIR